MSPRPGRTDSVLEPPAGVECADRGVLGATTTRPDAGRRPPAPAPGSAVTPLDGTPPADTLFVLRYCEETYAFAEGDWGRFGRDDEHCEIPIWEEINGLRLSRVAGEVWCADGDLWVRNLSTTHELAVAGGAAPPQWLPRRAEGHRGAACSLGGRTGRIVAPTTGWWELVVDAAHPTHHVAEPVTGAFTIGIGPVPRGLLPTAAALCAPILERDDPPATFDQVARDLGVTRRQVRRYVERLCEHYADHVPSLDATEPEERSVPGAAELARLLVRSGRVTVDDVTRLRQTGNDTSPGAEGTGDE